ncbi:branched-chain amino acid aminotransferase [Oceanihabitans sediminis]|uniref:Branched-chain-amino-acid aminotransferase n=1 Tax=Oceanihabitans sediminis TaxID=1812012 RepID=A0A368P1Y3_9FLAO|nr:branched-chain amino acid aminotransferase [Oceanihabitans sediminis]MDX1278154.1 branched-chain amino acid aminotransferase [Oceanihabitans sediminis]MDX1774059.1 branched-chain amino acid aminotransferase [Oceanihabitans sediminis]RBP30900.1 branched-chain amino acid aminotransferase [Oceanihabitans sediminis]RCU56862.1 branched-chain amino acid aminotransferase [Oceanihabitans sediminis]
MNNAIINNMEITTVNESKINSVDFESIAFGREFTDHMFSCDFKDGKWQTPKITPYQPLTLDPSARVFHYGQAVFEGMKAFKDDMDDVWLFRPEDNFNRINISAKRLAIPEFPKEYFLNGLSALIDLERDWIKKGEGNALYIRPFVIATEPAISASPANEFKFMIICSPVKSYYKGKVSVVFAQDYSRSANGGVGFAKAAGNYAAQFYPTSLVQKEGYQQIIWTDANTHEYLEEAGTMNIFFRVNDTLLTAPTSDRILDGITRKSIIQLAKDNNVAVEVRPVSVKEIKEAAKNGSLKEIFGSGTAAAVSPISDFKHGEETFKLEEQEDSYATFFKKKLTDIQYNRTEDKHAWRVKVEK